MVTNADELDKRVYRRLGVLERHDGDLPMAASIIKKFMYQILFFIFFDPAGTAYVIVQFDPPKGLL